MKTNIDKRKVTMELLKYEKYKTLEDLPVVTKVYLPPVTAVRKGVIQIVHGMCETKERYDHFINFFNEKGYICVICDLRGHGENVEFEKDLGYIGDDGASLMVEDIHTITIFIKNILIISGRIVSDTLNIFNKIGIANISKIPNMLPIINTILENFLA